MTFGKASTNKTHHNYNRPQSPKTRAVASLNWLTFSLKGFQRNIGVAIQQVGNSPLQGMLGNASRKELIELLNRAGRLVAEARELNEDIKEFQANKEWIP